MSLHVSAHVSQNDPMITLSHVCVFACLGTCKPEGPHNKLGSFALTQSFLFSLCMMTFLFLLYRACRERRCHPLRLEGEELSPLSISGYQQAELRIFLGCFLAVLPTSIASSPFGLCKRFQTPSRLSLPLVSQLQGLLQVMRFPWQ